MIHRTIARRIAAAAVIGAVAAGVGTLYDATLPVEGTPHPVLTAADAAYGDAPCASETDNEDAWQACQAAVREVTKQAAQAARQSEAAKVVRGRIERA